MSELLPCPFCGFAPDDLDYTEGSTYRWLAWSCPGCVVGGEERQGPYGNADRAETAKASARQFWNQRAAIPQPEPPSLELPPLPEPYEEAGNRHGTTEDYFTAHQMREYVLADRRLRAAPQVEAWISVGERLPALEEPVFAMEGGRIVFRVRSLDDDGWFWCNPYNSLYHNGMVWACEDAELDDEYAPTHWMPLPKLAAAQAKKPAGSAE